MVTSISTKFVGPDVTAVMEHKKPSGDWAAAACVSAAGTALGDQRSGLWSWSPGPTWSHKQQSSGEAAAVVHHGLEFTFQQLSHHPLPAESTGQESWAPRSAFPVLGLKTCPTRPTLSALSAGGRWISAVQDNQVRIESTSLKIKKKIFFLLL